MITALSGVFTTVLKMPMLSTTPFDARRLDRVADTKRPEEHEHHAGREVRQRVLEREADGEPRGADDREEIRRRHAERRDRGERHHHDEEHIDEAAEEARERLIHADALHRAPEPPRSARPR